MLIANGRAKGFPLKLNGKHQQGQTPKQNIILAMMKNWQKIMFGLNQILKVCLTSSDKKTEHFWLI
ncbi:MAG: hypothetical protein L6420_09370 [Elusimicrobia bacterium]|nr:hypothetical protein [Elusimicrobiota bacterium]